MRAYRYGETGLLSASRLLEMTSALIAPRVCCRPPARACELYDSLNLSFTLLIVLTGEVRPLLGLKFSRISAAISLSLSSVLSRNG